jgi:hypothetical protein
MSIPTKTSSCTCDIPSLWIRTQRRVLTTVRAYYTNAPGDLATNRPHGTKDVDDQPDAPARLSAESRATVHPPYQDVPKSSRFSTSPFRSTDLSNPSGTPTADGRDTRSSTSWNNIQGCGDQREPHGSGRFLPPMRFASLTTSYADSLPYLGNRALSEQTVDRNL